MSKFVETLYLNLLCIDIKDRKFQGISWLMLLNTESNFIVELGQF